MDICETYKFGSFYSKLVLLNTEIFGANVHIQSECAKYGPEKLRTRKPFTQW